MKKIIGMLLVIMTALIGVINGYETNQAAVNVIGQNDMSTNGSGTSDKKLYNPLTPYVYGGKLFIVDHSNSRVLIFNSIPTTNYQSADVVIGQQDFNSNQINQGVGPSGGTLATPQGLWAGNNKLIIADFRNNRVLIYNAIPTSNGAPADVVIGQSAMNLNQANQGGVAAANTLNWPKAVWSDGTRLFISDGNNHRVLIYNSIPTSNNASADLVIGQPDMVSINPGCTSILIETPGDIRTYGGKLYIADSVNNRILIYNSIPSSNNAAADHVIGQPDLISKGINQGLSSCAANTLYNPERFYIRTGRLLVSDTYNHRVLIYTTIPNSNNMPADIVIGQPDMNSSNANQGSSTTENTLFSPLGVTEYVNKLLVADFGNHRVMVYNISPPELTIAYPNHGVANQTVNVTLSGVDIGESTGIRLVNGSQTVSSTNINMVNSSKITCSFYLDSPPGAYDVELNRHGVIYIFPKMFYLLDKNPSEVNWIMSSLGTVPTPAQAGPYYGLTIGDGDNDGKQEVVVANRYTQLNAFDFTGNYWEKTAIPAATTGKYFSTVIIADIDNDKDDDIYTSALNGTYDISGFSSPEWVESIVGHGPDKLYDSVYGDGDNDGILEIFAAGENGSVIQYTYDNPWTDSVITTGTSRVVSLAIGNGKSDGNSALYSANADFHVYEHRFNGSEWIKTDVGLGESEMTAVAVGDGNNDNQIEVYGANKDGKVYQYKWMISSWDTTVVGNAGEILNDVIVNDGDNDGQNEVYASTNSGKLIQYKYASNQWTSRDIGSISGPLHKLAIGDGDNNNSFEIYGIAENNAVYQFAAQPLGPTPTPSPTPFAVDGFDGHLIAPKYTYTAPNPVRAHHMNFVVLVKEQVEIEVKMFTTSNKFVLSFNMTCPGPGKYEHSEYVGNLANGVYLLLVKAKNNQGVKDRLIKKIGLIK